MGEVTFKIRKAMLSFETLVYSKVWEKQIKAIKLTCHKFLMIVVAFSTITFGSMKPLERAVNDEIAISAIIADMEIVEEKYIDPIDRFRGNFPRELIEIVIITESEGNPNVPSYLGKEYGLGLMQISSIALEDFNLFNTEGKRYAQKDLIDPEINIEIGCWLLNRYDKILGYPTVNELYVAYNAGIGNCQKYYNSHYKHGKRPDGKTYGSLKRFARISDEYYRGIWEITF